MVLMERRGVKRRIIKWSIRNDYAERLIALWTYHKWLTRDFNPRWIKLSRRIKESLLIGRLEYTDDKHSYANATTTEMMPTAARSRCENLRSCFLPWLIRKTCSLIDFFFFRKRAEIAPGIFCTRLQYVFNDVFLSMTLFDGKCWKCCVAGLRSYLG